MTLSSSTSSSLYYEFVLYLLAVVAAFYNLFRYVFRIMMGSIETCFPSCVERLQSLFIELLRLQPLPKHIAIIMDGNRRFARKKGLNGVQSKQGHVFGFNKLEQMLNWCLKLDIKCITVYAFSIENFKRPKEEVDFLMDLAARKFQELSEHNELVSKYNVRINVIGDLSLLRPDVQEAAESAMKKTKNYNRYCFNIACPYTSREEMCSAVQKVSKLINSDTNLETVTNLIDEHMYTSDMYPFVDLLIRTSGVQRLSDFLLWQVSKGTHIEFIDVLWPEFSFWDMYSVLASYQYNSSYKQQQQQQQQQQ